MRTGAARGHAGHFHEAGFYGSDAEFRALILPFAEQGIAAGEPVILGYDNRKAITVKRTADTRPLGEVVAPHCVASVVREPTHGPP